MPPLDRDDDVQLPDIHSPEHRRALRERGRPHGAHIRPPDDDEPPKANSYARNGDVTGIVDELERRLGNATPPPKPWPMIAAAIATIVGVISIIGAANSYVKSNAETAATQLQAYTQMGDRLQSFGERLLAMDGRIVVLETLARDRGKELSSINAENGLQNERMQNFARALEQERQARIEAESDARRTDADQRAIVNDLMKSVGEMRADIKVIVDRAARRGDLGS